MVQITPHHPNTGLNLQAKRPSQARQNPSIDSFQPLHFGSAASDTTPSLMSQRTQEINTLLNLGHDEPSDSHYEEINRTLIGAVHFALGNEHPQKTEELFRDMLTQNLIWLDDPIKDDILAQENAYSAFVEKAPKTVSVHPLVAMAATMQQPSTTAADEEFQHLIIPIDKLRTQTPNLVEAIDEKDRPEIDIYARSILNTDAGFAAGALVKFIGDHTNRYQIDGEHMMQVPWKGELDEVFGLKTTEENSTYSIEDFDKMHQTYLSTHIPAIIGIDGTQIEEVAQKPEVIPIGNDMVAITPLLALAGFLSGKLSFGNSPVYNFSHFQDRANQLYEAIAFKDKAALQDMAEHFKTQGLTINQKSIEVILNSLDNYEYVLVPNGDVVFQGFVRKDHVDQIPFPWDAMDIDKEVVTESVSLCAEKKERLPEHFVKIPHTDVLGMDTFLGNADASKDVLAKISDPENTQLTVFDSKNLDTLLNDESFTTLAKKPGKHILSVNPMLYLMMALGNNSKSPEERQVNLEPLKKSCPLLFHALRDRNDNVLDTFKSTLNDMGYLQIADAINILQNNQDKYTIEKNIFKVTGATGDHYPTSNSDGPEIGTVNSSVIEQQSRTKRWAKYGLITGLIAGGTLMLAGVYKKMRTLVISGAAVMAGLPVVMGIAGYITSWAQQRGKAAAKEITQKG